MTAGAADRDEHGRLRRARLAAQLLQPQLDPHAVQVVAALCAVQAQEERWAGWSVGLRTTGSRHTEVVDALVDGRLVRTWLLRGTLHLVAAVDLGWLRRLVARRVIDGTASRYRRLGLDERTLELAADRLEGALRDGPLPRSALASELEGAGIDTTGQRLPHMLQYAALNGRLVCWPASGREPMHAPAPATAPVEPTLVPADAVARLAERYLVGHGPASAADFAWWSGFPTRDARRALGSVPGVRTVRWMGRELMTLASGPTRPTAPSAHLLPAFDEYLIGYRDREAAFAAGDAQSFNRDGGMPRRALLLDGTVAGTWMTPGSGKRRRLELRTYRTLTRAERERVETAAALLHRFYDDDPLPLAFVGDQTPGQVAP